MAKPISGGARVQTNNKLDMDFEDGTYNVTIADEWVHYVLKEQNGTWTDGTPRFQSKFSRTPTDDQEIKVSVTLDDAPDIAIEKRMPFYASKNAAYAKMVASLTGMLPGSPEMKEWDSKGLVGMKAVADLKYNKGTGYVRIAEIRARPKSLARPAIRPSAAPAETLADYADDRLGGASLEDEVPF